MIPGRAWMQHLKRCSVFYCANCGFPEWLHDAAEDIDEQTCARRNGLFWAKTDCSCGLDAFLASHGQVAEAEPQKTCPKCGGTKTVYRNGIVESCPRCL